jgi:polyribonucleotide nucleotidyltransferase
MYRRQDPGGFFKREGQRRAGTQRRMIDRPIRPL